MGGSKKYYIPFDQYQRYATIAEIIDYYRRENAGEIFRVLEIGANEHKNMALFLPNDEIVFTDVTLTEAMRRDPDFQQADGTELPFDDEAFDFVFAADVFEHIPADRRPRFLSEASRVAKNCAILSFPFSSQDTVDAETRVNTYYKAITGQDYIWLKEHRENGLPEAAEVDGLLENLGLEAFSFRHGAIKTWEKMWYGNINAMFMPEAREYHADIDHFYNCRLYRADVARSCYRVFYVIAHSVLPPLERHMREFWEEPQAERLEFLDTLLQVHQQVRPLREDVVQHAKTPALADNSRAQATIYWDVGEGYTEALHTQAAPHMPMSGGAAYFHINDVPKGCIHARFDPVRNQLCLVSDLHVTSNIRSCEFRPLNGTQINGVIAFSNTNPQIEIDLPEGAQWIAISADIQIFTSPAYGEILSAVQDIPYLNRRISEALEKAEHAQQALASLEQLHQELQSVDAGLRVEKEQLLEQARCHEERARREADALHTRIAELAEEKADCIARSGREGAELRAQITCLSEQLGQAKDIETQLQQMTAYARHVEALYHQLAEQYNTMAGSRSWRITAPVRCVLDWIKRRKIVRLMKKGLLVLRTQGLRAAGRKVFRHASAPKQTPMLVAEAVESFSALVNKLSISPDCTVYLPEILAGFDEQAGKKVLLVSHELNLTGAPVAVYYFAQILKEEGCCPFVIAPRSGKLTESIVEEGIPVIVCGALFDSRVVHSFAHLLDFAVANTVVTAPVVQDIDGVVPVLWWIHEAEASYSEEHVAKMPLMLPSNVIVCAVGQHARRLLLEHRPNYAAGQLLYYIPDRIGDAGISASAFVLPPASKGKTVFCCIGMLEYRKGQDIAVEAIRRLPQKDLLAGYFVFVGRQCYPENYQRIRGLCAEYPDHILYVEELPMDDMGKLEQQMDCLICSSRDDPMPIVVTEALQFSKLVICSEHTGSAQLLEQEKGGLVYYNDDPQELANCISQVLHHGREMGGMKAQARAIYDQYFSRTVFRKNVLELTDKLLKSAPGTSSSLAPLEAKSSAMAEFLREYDDMREASDCAYSRETLLEYDHCPRARRVLLLSHELSLTGAPIALQYLAQCFRAQGAQVVVLSPTDGPMAEELAKDCIPTVVYCKMYEDAFLSCQAFRFDLVVLNTVVTYRAIDLLRNCDIPILWWIHDSEASYRVGGFQSCLPSDVPKTVRIFCVGEYARKQLLAYYPHYSAEILLYMVPDCLEQSKSYTPYEMGRTPGKMAFTVIGQQDFRKGHDILVKAIRCLTPEERNAAQFYFVGAHLDREIQEAVDGLCAEYPGQVVYIPHVNRQDCFSIQRQSDCIICSSRDDPLPVFVTEAMMLERTVICSEHTGWAPIIEREECGLLYHNDDPEELAGQIRYVLRHNQELDSMRSRGREVYLREFSEKAAQGHAAQLLNTMVLQQDADGFEGAVSVIIPTYNAGPQFETLLQALKGQCGVRSVEVVVVDSGSTDQTEALCRKHNTIFIPIPHEDFSHSYARNKGAAQARGDILIFMTQDALPQDGLWMSHLIEPLVSGEAAAVSCREQCPDGTDLYYAAASWNHSKFQGIQETDRLNRADSADTADDLRSKAALNDVTVAIRADIFKRYLYRFNYAEDLDMGLRILLEGYPIKLLASTATIHGHNRPAGYYLKRGFVEVAAVGKICEAWKAPVEPDEVAARKLVCGNALLQEAIGLTRAQNSTPLGTQAFFAILLQNLEQVNRYSGSGAMAMGGNSEDPVLNWCLSELTPMAGRSTIDEKELFHHVCWYLEHVLHEYMREKGILEVDRPMQEAVYGCMEKQFCVSAGGLLGRLDAGSELCRKMKRLQEGV